MLSKNMKLLVLLLIILSCNSSRSQNFILVDEVIKNAITEKIFPGAVIAVGNSDEILYHKTYGRFTYDEDSPEVAANTMFDLASVTKAFGTNFCVMKLYEEGKLDLNKPVSYYLPKFAQNSKEKVRVVDLLIHESGLQAYYTPGENQTRADIIETIMALPLNYETNTKTVYSCLNFVTSMLLVESITREPMHEYYRKNFIEPLGLKHTMFVPSDDLIMQCIPTLSDRQGKVHDPLAYGLEGFSGNAGLFSTAEDLAALAKLLLNKGSINGKKILQESTVELFTKKYSERSTRALGFDTKSPNQTSSSGQYFSMSTYGHLGYTGTSVWIDPENKIYVVLLTNRVFPDDSKKIQSTRPKVHDAVFLSLFGNAK